MATKTATKPKSKSKQIITLAEIVVEEVPRPTTRAFQEHLQACQQCPLFVDRKTAVAGEGPLDARVVIVGEAPGADEDESGRPFYGAAGRLLTTLLAEAGIDRRQVFITNAVRCRPVKHTAAGPRNGKPKTEQVRACRNHLAVELSHLDPALVIVMGDVPLTAVTERKGITKWRGEVFQIELPTRSGVRLVKVMPTFHPAYALYDARQRPIITEDLRKAARELKRKTFVSPPRTETIVCRTVDDVRDMVDLLLEQDLVAFDTETAAPTLLGGLDYRHAQPICVSFTWQEGVGAVIPLYGQLALEDWDRETGVFAWEKVAPIWTEEEREIVLAELRRFFTSDVPKTAHNAKFDMHMLGRIDVPVNAVVLDTMLAHAILDENQPHNLEFLRSVYTPLPRYEGWKDRSLPRADAPFLLADPETELWPYSAGDTDVTYRAALKILDEFESPAQAGMQGLYTRVIHPLAEATRRLEQTGLRIDRERMRVLQGRYNTWIKEEELALERAVGRKINYGSTKQLSEVLFGELGFPPVKVTKGGAPSTDAETMAVLGQMYSDHPVLRSLLHLRKLTKARDTYLAGKDGFSGMLQWIDSDGIIHTRYKVHGPVTGRLSSEDPNLQNISKKNEKGDADEVEEDLLTIRSIFAAPPGYYLLEADYSQLELRLQAYITGERILLNAFASGQEVDQHKLTAALVYGIPVEKVTKEMRTEAKRVNFGVGYGGGIPMIMRVTGWDEERSREFLEKMRAGYPATELKRNQAKLLLREHGFVRTIFGRRRRFPDYRKLVMEARGDTDDSRRARGLLARMDRQAYNFWIQSTGSDFLSLATIEAVLDHPELTRLGVLPCLTLHDALYFYVPVGVVQEAAWIVKAIMEGQPKKLHQSADWYLPVDITWGERWGEEYKVGEIKWTTALAA